ncbi:sterol regulatory element binding protein 1 [Echinococcus multilocularis]|uniref:Sterol regulatory element binding protein 1 n=1 Tax=Echinococcus multilocularis TaxID=6211 RepID=A0A068YJI0_ECHMU|nr:sterol regulatory element binding protein 1 [Echinococcus multilocularis]
MCEFETKAPDDEFASAFDDLDIDAIPLFQTDFVNDVDLDFLLMGCETQSSNNDIKDGNFTRKNSTLASLLKPHPSCGYVPPAPQIHMESNSVIEPGTYKPPQVNLQEYEKHPQLKNALIQEKSLAFSPQSAGVDSVDGSFCAGSHPGHSFNDALPIAVNQLNTTNYQHTRAEPQAEGCNLSQQSDDVKSIRRSPHNAIERRYRQSINGKINELREILNASSGDDTKTNKSAVLRRAIDRIRYLEKENECLRIQLSMYENGYAVVNDIDKESHLGFKSSKGRLVRIKADPAAIPQQVEVLRPIHKLRQSPMSRSRALQQPINSWSSQSGHLPPIASSDESSPPSMIGVSSIISSASDDVSAISSPESYQFIHVSRKRNADVHLFQQACPSDAKMGAFYAPGDRSTDDGPIQLPCQSLIMASDGFGRPSPICNPADVAYSNVSSTSVNGSNGCQAQIPSSNESESNFTRLSLFWGSFSLLMFNPFVISSSGDANREGAHPTGMPILRLLSAISLSFRHSKESGGTSSALSPLFLSFLYAAQWVVAILLLLFACPRNFGSILPSFLTWGCGKRIQGVVSKLPGGQVALMHWKQSQEYTKKKAWVEAGSQLKESLTVLGASPSIGNGFISAFCARASAYVEGLRFTIYRLPQFFWPLLRKYPIPRASHLSQSDEPTVSQLRRQLLDLKFLDLIHLSNNDPVTQECPVVSEMSSRECLHVVHLMFACLNDFVVGWRSAHRGRSVDLAELTRLGLVLALSVKRFFGVNWLGDLLLRATQRIAGNLNDGSICLGPEDGPIMAMLLALFSNEFCQKHKVEGKGTVYNSFLKIQLQKSNGLPSKSLVVDEVNYDLCEIFITRALECIVFSNLEPTSPFESYLKEIKRLTLRLYSEKSSFFRTLSSDGSLESSLLLTHGGSDSEAAWEEKVEQPDENNIWWLSILETAGRWYTSSLDFEDVATVEHITPSPSKMDADARLISLAYNLLYVTQSKAFNAAEASLEVVAKPLLEVWMAGREASDLLEQTPSRKCGSLAFPLEKGFKQTVDLRNYVYGMYQLVAQDWILHSLNSIANRLQQESSHRDGVVFGTSGCHQPSLSFNSIIHLFSDTLERQRRLVRCLQASPALWLTKVEVMYRQLNRANPVWTNLIRGQRIPLVQLRKALSDKAPRVNTKRPIDGWEMSTQKSRLVHTKYIGQ